MITAMQKWMFLRQEIDSAQDQPHGWRFSCLVRLPLLNMNRNIQDIYLGSAEWQCEWEHEYGAYVARVRWRQSIIPKRDGFGLSGEGINA